MTLKGGTSQACAACKYQRRRCTPECPLAPYFPPDQPKLFQNAHRLFGVSNILKILKKLEPDQKATAMWSIIYQSNERDRDPVHGCLGRISHLRYQIWHLEQELLSLHARIEMCRQQQQQQHNNNTNNNNSQNQLELVMAPPSSNLQLPDQSHSEAYCVNNSNNNNNSEIVNNGIGVDGNNGDGMWVVQYPYDNSVGPEQFVGVAQMLDGNNHHQELVQDYDEMPFFDTMDDRQSYIDSKEAYDSSSEESVLEEANNQNQAMEHLVDNELKNAAACLSLTSVN